MSLQFDAERLTALAAELQAESEEVATTQAVLQCAVETIPGAEMASLTVRARAHTFRTLGWTDRLAEVVDEAQYSLGEGPCIESAEGVEWFRSGELADDKRWLRWAPMAVANGLHSMLAVRLDSQGEPFGALNIYSTQPGAFADRDDIDTAVVFAVHAANALKTARLVTGLETALGSRHDIGMAQGILVERYGLTVEQSFAVLQRLSQHLNRKLRDLAADIVRTREVPGVLPLGEPDSTPRRGRKD